MKICRVMRFEVKIFQWDSNLENKFKTLSSWDSNRNLKDFQWELKINLCPIEPQISLVSLRWLGKLNDSSVYILSCVKFNVTSFLGSLEGMRDGQPQSFPKLSVRSLRLFRKRKSTPTQRATYVIGYLAILTRPEQTVRLLPSLVCLNETQFFGEVFIANQTKKSQSRSMSWSSFIIIIGAIK